VKWEIINISGIVWVFLSVLYITKTTMAQTFEVVLIKYGNLLSYLA